MKKTLYSFLWHIFIICSKYRLLKLILLIIKKFHIFEIIFCFVVSICDLVHTVEAMYGLP